jgi:hypothetical protein
MYQVPCPNAGMATPEGKSKVFIAGFAIWMVDFAPRVENSSFFQVLKQHCS